MNTFSRRDFAKRAAVAISSPMIVPVSGLGQDGQKAAAERLRFVASDDEEYRFDTGTLRGTLRSGGKSFGLSSLLHVPSGTRVDGAAYGILSHYRVFASNHRYGNAAWEWPSTSKLLPNGGVEIRWPAGEDHPFELTAVYRLCQAGAIDLETTVKAREDLPKFESFLASYFDKAFAGSSVYVKTGSQAEPKPAFATTERSFGVWQMFPRCRKVVSLIEDGRWRKPPHPVDWKIRQDLAAPLGVRRHEKNGVCAILMTPSDDCFAVSTPYKGEGHFSLYFSLFGRDVKAGETATARLRMIVASAPTDERILALYRSYIKG